MIPEKKLKATLFGEEIILDFGMRFSSRIRAIYPNFGDIAESGDASKLMIISVVSALPKSLHHKTEDEIIDELDNLNDPILLHACLQGFQDAMGFFAAALNGAVKMAVAVEKAKVKGEK